MTITELKERLTALEERIKEDALKIIGNTAVRMFKENFQEEGFFGQRWREVKRRQPQRSRRGSGRAPVDAQRKILTGTGDLGRSIEVAETGEGRVKVWTNPDIMTGSKEPYGKVHNEGLPAGRGAGFVMPKREFMGDHPKLQEAVKEALEKELGSLLK